MKTQVCVLSLSHSLCLSYTQATKRPTSGDGPVQGMSASYRNVTGRLHPSKVQLLITLFKSGVAHNIPFHLFPSSRPHHQLVPPPRATRYGCESRSVCVCVFIVVLCTDFNDYKSCILWKTLVSTNSAREREQHNIHQCIYGDMLWWWWCIPNNMSLQPLLKDVCICNVAGARRPRVQWHSKICW